MGEFAVYAVPLGTGTLALSPLPGRFGDYRADLIKLVAWQPDAVISMTQQTEMDQRGAAGLGTDLQDAGVRWLHVPVADFDVPSSGGETLWRAAAEVALDVLAVGGRVLIHCHGGCGRSGMAVLNLMVKSGEAPDAALARLRLVRPCAVETQEQLQWALGRVI